MPRATGLTPRRSHVIDAETILVGDVLAGFNRAAETRTGAARMLTTSLNSYDHFKAVIYGQDAAAAGGYLIEVAHVPVDGAIGDATGWATIGILSADGEGYDELVFSGVNIFNALKAEPSAGQDVRGFAVRATAGTGANGADVPAGTITLVLQPTMGA